jgi:capsular exopolysaccharide synthesis family protein
MLFDLKSEPGLTNMILEENAEPLLQETSVDNLWLFASGQKPPNPADMLGSKKTEQVIKQLLGMADIVLFNAPSVIAVTDAAVLGAKVGGVVLVINDGKTRRDHTKWAKELLEKAKVRIVGTTLTNAPKDSSLGDYYG